MLRPIKKEECPDVLKLALQQDNYSKDGADFSVTEILKPPQVTFLAQANEPREMPLYKGFMSLMGTGLHYALEQAAHEGHTVEHRFFWEFDVDGEKVTLGGKPDFIYGRFLNDYKFVLTSAVGDTAKPEHYEQGQFNSWLANKNGCKIEEASVEYIFRDWTWSRAKYNKNYPQKPNLRMPFPIEDPDVVEKRILERLTLHVRAKQGINTECSAEDRWRRQDVYALMKPDGKRSRKNCVSIEEAEANKRKNEVIEYRPGENTRCKDWCEYSHVCPQYQRILARAKD